MHRDTMQNKDFFSVLPLKRVAFWLSVLFGTKKVAYLAVK